MGHKTPLTRVLLVNTCYTGLQYPAKNEPQLSLSNDIQIKRDKDREVGENNDR